MIYAGSPIPSALGRSSGTNISIFNYCFEVCFCFHGLIAIYCFFGAFYDEYIDFVSYLPLLFPYFFPFYYFFCEDLIGEIFFV